ncbi:MAG: hypothetical protein ACRD5J_17085 [Nitrososphaeraceae archaeon]
MSTRRNIVRVFASEVVTAFLIPYNVDCKTTPAAAAAELSPAAAAAVNINNTR